MPRPKYYNPADMFDYCPDEMDDCPNHCDLYLLRESAADERGAIADYLCCAINNPCVAEVFLDAAEDEMQHYVEIMRLISWLDPVQRKMLKEQNLDYLTMKKLSSRANWAKKYQTEDAEDVKVSPPHKKDLAAVRCFTKAIQDELHAINKYQRFMNEAEEPRVKKQFCELMNEEKEHVAEFTAALYELTNEPLPEEAD
ncbi:MAG: ferritin-like domain-containing protein [Veillonellales bacterium]